MAAQQRYQLSIKESEGVPVLCNPMTTQCPSASIFLANASMSSILHAVNCTHRCRSDFAEYPDLNSLLMQIITGQGLLYMHLKQCPADNFVLLFLCKSILRISSPAGERIADGHPTSGTCPSSCQAQTCPQHPRSRHKHSQLMIDFSCAC